MTFRLFLWSKRTGSEEGSSLLETIVAMALLGIIAVGFLGALATTTKSRSIADEHVSARNIAEYQLENIKQQDYAPSYDAIPVPSEYPGYTASVQVDSMRNGSFQKITVTVIHHNKDIIALEGFKTDR
jgi:Tfp pilus assembly protein PilV